MQIKELSEPVRLDKWLWAARFFKTRGLAAEAINGGKVHVDDTRVKSSKKIKVGMVITLSMAHSTRTVIVEKLRDKRGPASIAQTMYEETAESLQRQEEMAELRRLNVQFPKSINKPNKKERRQIRQFKAGS